MAVQSVGIDLSITGMHRAEAIDITGQRCGHLSFRTTPEGLAALADLCFNGDSAPTIVLEPTGLVWLPIVPDVPLGGLLFPEAEPQQNQTVRRRDCSFFLLTTHPPKLGKALGRRTLAASRSLMAVPPGLGIRWQRSCPPRTISVEHIRDS